MTLRTVGNDIRDRVIDIASQVKKVKEDALDIKDAAVERMDRHYEDVSDGLRKLGKKVRRYSRRHPARVIAGALTVGFLLGRLGRNEK